MTTSEENGPQPEAPKHSPGARLLAMLGQRCPRCLKGPMFSSGMTMNDPCPVCGLVFQREEGYFLGAMYTSYAIGTVVLGAFYLIASALLPTWSSLAVAFVALVPFIPLIPAVFRYSRVLWIYLDRTVDPGSSSAGAYEKLREHQRAEGGGKPPAGAT